MAAEVVGSLMLIVLLACISVLELLDSDGLFQLLLSLGALWAAAFSIPANAKANRILRQHLQRGKLHMTIEGRWNKVRIVVACILYWFTVALAPLVLFLGKSGNYFYFGLHVSAFLAAGVSILNSRLGQRSGVLSFNEYGE